MISISDDQHFRERRLLALADGTRGRIVEMLAARPHTASEIHRAFPIAAPAVSRHLRVLREAGLIQERRPEEDRRVRLYTLRPEPMQEVAGWLEELSRGWQTFAVNLANAAGNATIADAQAVGTIVNDDRKPARHKRTHLTATGPAGRGHPKSQ
jgi:DNA-binding transcriptional ArsR family regulator